MQYVLYVNKVIQFIYKQLFTWLRHLETRWAILANAISGI